MSCLAPLKKILGCKGPQRQRKGKLVHRFFLFLLPFQNKLWPFIWLTNQCPCYNNKLVICPWNMYPTQWCSSDHKVESEYSRKKLDDPHLLFWFHLLKLPRVQGAVLRNMYPFIVFPKISLVLARNYTHASIPLLYIQPHWSPNSHNL